MSEARPVMGELLPVKSEWLLAVQSRAVGASAVFTCCLLFLDLLCC